MNKDLTEGDNTFRSALPFAHAIPILCPICDNKLSFDSQPDAAHWLLCPQCKCQIYFNSDWTFNSFSWITPNDHWTSVLHRDDAFELHYWRGINIKLKTFDIFNLAPIHQLIKTLTIFS